MDNNWACVAGWAIIVTSLLAVKLACEWRDRRRQRRREAMRREVAAEVQRAWERRLADALQGVQIVRALGPTVPAEGERN